MNPLNDEHKKQQSSKRANELPPLDSGVVPVPDASTREALGPIAKPRSPRKRAVDETPKEERKLEKAKPAGKKAARGEQLIVAKDSTTPVLKPARAKRTQKQADAHVDVQAKPVSRPSSESNRKQTEDARFATETIGDANDVPPITPSAIDYLRKQNATLADYIKLDPDSLTFVRYHLKRMHQLEADRRPRGEYADAKTRPVSPALQRFAKSRPKDPEKIRSSVAVRVSANSMAIAGPAQMGTGASSYGQKITENSAYKSVVVQLGNFELATRKAGTEIQAGEITMDDNERMRGVIGTAQILVATPNSKLALADATKLAACDIKDVRAMQNMSKRRLALSAVIDGGLAQPLYHSEFARQAPDLVRLATVAHKAKEADRSLAYEVMSNLSNLVGSEMSLTKNATATLARRTIAAIRAIEVPQYREQLLAISHQVGLWYPQYRTDFAHNAPDLVATADVAYRAEESRTQAGSKSLRMDENSIEQSPLLLVTKDHPVRHNDQAESAADGVSSSGRVSRGPSASATFDGSGTPRAAARPRLGRRLLLAIESSTIKAKIWLSMRREKSVDSVGNMPMYLEKPIATPVDADDKSSMVPESVARRFLKVESEYYFQDRTPAFSDRGSKLATRGANLEVVRSMVEIAKARGWDTITVKGTEEFRRSAWMEATQDGLTVAGYKPTSLDLAALANRPANNTVDKGVFPSKVSVPVQSSAGRSSSEVDNTRRASTHHAEKIEPVPGTLRPDPELVAKARAFEEEMPASVVKRYPDLARAYGVVAAAKAFASEKLSEASRNEFIEMAKRHMVEKITAGQQIQGPKIYMEPAKAIDAGDPVKKAAGTADRGEQPGAKAVNLER